VRHALRPILPTCQPRTSGLVEERTSTPDRLSAKIARLKRKQRIPEKWEPDEPGKSDYSGSEDPAMAWEKTTWSSTQTGQGVSDYP